MEGVNRLQPWLLVGLGIFVLITSTLLRGPLSRRMSGWPIAAALVFAVTMVIALSSIAAATHQMIAGWEISWTGSPWNGYKVYLSSPRHVTSGGRGECGWEENINGRHWNHYAASDTRYMASFWDRKYAVTVSANARDRGYPQNVSSANSWGADVYIVTHTNAFVGCGNSASYLRTMSRSGVANSVGLANELSADLDPALPGSTSPANCDNLYECLEASASHRSYVELFFHTNPAAVNWFQGDGLEGNGGVTESWRYGWAVDVRLGYPR